MKIIVILLLTLFSTQCSRSYEKSYLDLESAFIDWYHKFHPVQSSLLGYSGYDASFPKLDKDSQDEYIADVNRFTIELSQIDETKLSSDALLNYYFLTDFLKNEVYNYDKLNQYEWDVSIYTTLLYNGFISIIDGHHLEMTIRVEAILTRLIGATEILNYAKENLKFYSQWHAEKSLRTVKSLQLMLDEIPLKISGDNATLDKIDGQIVVLLRDLQKLKSWINQDYTQLEPLSPMSSDKFKRHFKQKVGASYSIEKIPSLTEKKIHSIQNELFTKSLPVYLLHNDEPIWIDRDDSLNIVFWVKNHLSKDKIPKHEFISTIYASSRRVHQFTQFDKNFNIYPIPKIRIEESYPYVEQTEFIEFLQYQTLYKPEIISILLDDRYFSNYNNLTQLDLYLMRTFTPGNLQLLTAISNNPLHIRKLFIHNVTQLGWKYFSEQHLIENCENSHNCLAYEILNLHEQLQLAALSWLEIKLQFEGEETQKMIPFLEKQVKFTSEEIRKNIDLLNVHMLTNTQSFIGLLELERLWNDFQRENQSATLLDFNTKFLKLGAIPIIHLRHEMLK